ncbi:MAG: hypothetical protein WC915_03230 [archaeon]|jgi:hypothetical protein
MLIKHPGPKKTIKKLQKKAQISERLRKQRILPQTLIGSAVVMNGLAKGSLAQVVGGVSATMALNEFTKFLNKKGLNFQYTLSQQLIGKPRIAQKVSEKVKTPLIKAMYQLCGFAKTPKQKQAIKNFIYGKESIQEMDILHNLIRERNLKIQNNNLQKLELFFRKNSSHYPNQLQEIINRISSKLKSQHLEENHITEIFNESLTHCSNIVLDDLGVHDTKTRETVINSFLKMQLRAKQKVQMNNTNFSDDVIIKQQISKIQELLSPKLANLFMTKSAQTTAFTTEALKRTIQIKFLMDKQLMILE